MIYPNTTFAGQKATICNRYVEQFRQEANSHASGVNARALIAEFNALVPEAYHKFPLIWLGIKWQDVVNGNEDLGFPGLDLAVRLSATAKKDEALSALRKFYKYQREVFTPTVKTLLHERHKAEQECRQDATHNPTLADFKRVNGKLSLAVPSKKPLEVNESTNIAFAMRALELYPDIDNEHSLAISEALGNAKDQTNNSDHWDKKLNKELVRVSINLPEPPDPIEDFTTYIKFTDKVPDPLVITAPTITGTAVSRNEKTLVYKSIPISGDFTHQIDTKQTNVSGAGVLGTWSLTQTGDIDDIVALRAASKNFLHMQHNGGTAYILFEEYLGTSYSDFNAAMTNGVEYFQTIARDTTIGSFGQLTNSIFTDINRTLSKDVLSVLLHANLSYANVWGLMSHDDNNGSTCDITVSNLDLGGVAGFNPSWARNSNRVIGSGVL